MAKTDDKAASGTEAGDTKRDQLPADKQGSVGTAPKPAPGQPGFVPPGSDDPTGTKDAVDPGPTKHAGALHDADGDNARRRAAAEGVQDPNNPDHVPSGNPDHPTKTDTDHETPKAAK